MLLKIFTIVDKNARIWNTMAQISNNITELSCVKNEGSSITNMIKAKKGVEIINSFITFDTIFIFLQNTYDLIIHPMCSLIMSNEDFLVIMRIHNIIINITKKSNL